jgi:hypothetical protein
VKDVSQENPKADTRGLSDQLIQKMREVAQEAARGFDAEEEETHLRKGSQFCLTCEEYGRKNMSVGRSWIEGKLAHGVAEEIESRHNSVGIYGHEEVIEMLEAFGLFKEQNVAVHIRASAGDGCTCEPCIAAREALEKPDKAVYSHASPAPGGCGLPGHVAATKDIREGSQFCLTCEAEGWLAHALPDALEALKNMTRPEFCNLSMENKAAIRVVLAASATVADADAETIAKLDQRVDDLELALGPGANVQELVQAAERALRANFTPEKRARLLAALEPFKE